MSQRRRDTLPKNRKGVAGGSASQRRISRREREERQRRQLYIGLAIAAALSVVIVAGFALNEYFFKPRTVLASVNGVEIRRRDYWKVRSVDLVNQVNQYNQFSQLVDPSQQQQYITLAQQASAELDDVWGSTSIDDATLTRMVEDQVYLQSLESMGLSITDQDVQDYLHTQFQPSNAPIFTPTPSPTLIPQRAEWATQTDVALVAESETPTAAAEEGTPAAGGATPVNQPVSPGGSPEGGSPETQASPHAGSPSAVASPIAGSPTSVTSPINASPTAGSPTSMATPVIASPSAVTSPVVAASPAILTGSPVGSPVGSPIGSPVASPIAQETATVAEATPNATEAIQTAEAGYDSYRDVVFDIAHLSRSDYVRLIVRPAIARQKVEDTLLKDVGQSAPQVHAEHILVDTRDLADSIYAELQGGANFEETAREQSNDTSTAENGGDLGWFARGQMVPQFEDTAFAMQPGQISAPFQTQFGWHIVKVIEADPNRALTDQQMQQYRDSIVSRWVDAQKSAMKISSKVDPTPTPAVSSFVPPADAPPLPTPTPEPIVSPIADQASPVGNPALASPVASPLASPQASPATSPAASPSP